MAANIKIVEYNMTDNSLTDIEDAVQTLISAGWSVSTSFYKINPDRIVFVLTQ